MNFLVVHLVEAVEEGVVALDGGVGADRDAHFRELKGAGAMDFRGGDLHIEGDHAQGGDGCKGKDGDEEQHADESETVSAIPDVGSDPHLLRGVGGVSGALSSISGTLGASSSGGWGNSPPPP